ncbi:uncharacterized protein BX664DRAFT_330649 [Halteromyces radiatus]|uniref:uncharacterized protein n=1 Tax=Halteromyces radiatus TaxID=101107 RepID=UPI00221F7555|nr:uncharacterized protein BX664DRAFT_330649 [Halteromyces radiatus]KAI8093819.1 hypothetical protein BX664DRAFT_330649 [Halteromyces radiatus]
MPLGSNLADIAHKSMVLFLAGTTLYYVTNISIMVKHRMDLKKEGRLEEELARMSAIAFGKEKTSDQPTTSST